MDLVSRIRRAKRVYLVGNGGSYANASHIANDLLSVGVKAYTLDPASLTAAANDHGYAAALARWLRTVGEPGDMLIALSGSGESANILRAVNVATLIGMDAALITWRLQPPMDMQASEEQQLVLGHDWMRRLQRDAQ